MQSRIVILFSVCVSITGCGGRSQQSRGAAGADAEPGISPSAGGNAAIPSAGDGGEAPGAGRSSSLGGRSSMAGLGGGASGAPVVESGGGQAGEEPVCPAVQDLGSVPDAVCSDVVNACDPGREPSSCTLGALSSTVARLAHECNAYCGDVTIAWSHGCATDLQPIRFGTLQGTTFDAASQCLRSALLGTRWDCAPPTGWYSAYLGSCTITK